MDTGLSQTLRRLMEQAGAEALRRFRTASPDQKSDGSVVTEADKAAEEILVEGLIRHFPGEGIVGEEGAAIEARAGAPTWYVDPIDGTSSFVGQLAYWGPTVARRATDGLDVGGFYVPRLQEYWHAERGGGAWRDGVRLEPAEDRLPIGERVLFAPSRFHARAPAPWPGKVRALGSGAAHMALVAGGSGVGAVVSKWALWDVGCGALLIRETGRMIWDLAGEPLAVEWSAPGVPFLAGTPQVLEALTSDGWARRAIRRSPGTDRGAGEADG